MKKLRIVLFFFAAVMTATAAPLAHDLGEGLLFFRVRELPADLPTNEAARKQPRVLDLRYARGEADAAASLEAWFKARATPRTPVFVLANTDTAPALLEAVRKFEPIDSVMTIGIAVRGFRPDLAVQSSAENERRAYDALEKGVKPAALLVENPEKVRNDEASLSRDRLAEASADAAADAAKKQPEPPPIDAALQRAVHLHRALVALKKI